MVTCGGVALIVHPHDPRGDALASPAVLETALSNIVTERVPPSPPCLSARSMCSANRMMFAQESVHSPIDWRPSRVILAQSRLTD